MRFLLIVALILISEIAMADDKKLDVATLAGGCFWCTEAPYDEAEGVESAISGYANGHIENPTYEQVTSGASGHYECVQVTYDPSINSYEDILELFWKNIDPFDAGGQFYDRGPQYQTAIFYHNDEQKKIAEASKAKIEERFGKEVATKILPYEVFYPAEDYHQNYYKTNPLRYNAYKYGSGRVGKLEKIWNNE